MSRAALLASSCLPADRSLACTPSARLRSVEAASAVCRSLCARTCADSWRLSVEGVAVTAGSCRGVVVGAGVAGGGAASAASRFRPNVSTSAMAVRTLLVSSSSDLSGVAVTCVVVLRSLSPSKSALDVASALRSYRLPVTGDDTSRVCCAFAVRADGEPFDIGVLAKVTAAAEDEGSRSREGGSPNPDGNWWCLSADLRSAASAMSSAIARCVGMQSAL